MRARAVPVDVVPVVEMGHALKAGWTLLPPESSAEVLEGFCPFAGPHEEYPEGHSFRDRRLVGLGDGHLTCSIGVTFRVLPAAAEDSSGEGAG